MVQDMIKILDQYWYVFLEGLGGTLSLAAITVFFGMIFGAVLAIIKLSKSKIVQFISTAYIEIIRGTPLLLQLYFFWLFLPKYLPFEISDWTCIVIALVINSSAYVAEIIRAGIQAVDKGQMEAAKSLGMSDVHMMTRIIFPQAVKNILPALGNEFIMMVKETSLASVFFINDLMTSYQMIKSATFKPIAPLMITAVIYFIVTFSLSKVVKAMEGRLSVSD
ncbi:MULTISPECIES: amino acid ABC transporter permease [Turicibacter]|jgi:amino ABC transporter, permease protein, 3-TM region, his/glu/gln/arg/opine family|uniref:ABC transporter permease subunit n=2 Tax=Turicibacter sanguinis TaxID=154288 RepID=A0A9X5APH7_9FIRM|nr:MULTISPECIES: amino acid ABC transporter permease [Turicibacter]KAB6698742.1 amino acid ABC transporter permease [Phocaeicola vulgatus]EFF64297.1 ABC transporter, permease protein [Turicibacter sanguinis PC909]MBP3904277.1 amino acid ABC transporter permease [Turicibacter sp.]MCU7192626.1 amino acid ABC transporter permease [Turicibacter sanguinis]MCU7198101.1 amino acid ABC transporter permease [Turicibacter sanguinis]